MASTLKIDTITTPDGTGNITVSRPLSGSGASLTSLPAANLTGTLPAINGSSLTGISAQKNIIINGDFDIWQRGTSFAAAANGTRIADRWRYLKSGAMVHTISRDTDVPTVAESGHLSNYSLKVDCTTIDSSIAAGDYSYIEQRVEGYNFKYLAQKAMKLSFWHKHTKTGTYCVGYLNSAGDRSYVTEYTQSVTDTWEKAEMDITASPSGGTWDYTNGIGLKVYFSIATGSSFHGTADTWESAEDYGSSSQVNACDNTANNFMLAQVQLEAGSVATDFEIRNHATELAMCQRYYQKSYSTDVAPATSTTAGFVWLDGGVPGNYSADHTMVIPIRYPIKMRTSPSVTLYTSGGTSGSCNMIAGEVSGLVLYGGETGFNLQGSNGAVSIQRQLGCHYTASAEL